MSTKAGKGAGASSRRSSAPKAPEDLGSSSRRTPQYVRLSIPRVHEILGYLRILGCDARWLDDVKLTEQINYLRLQIGLRPICLVHLHDGQCESDELGSCLTGKGNVLMREVGKPLPIEKLYEKRHVTK